MEEARCNKSSRGGEPTPMQLTTAFRMLAVAPLPVPTGWYALPLRLVVGLGFFEHGYAKLYRGADAFIAILHAIGMPFADLLGWATKSPSRLSADC
jgi:putative oxidoreductase